MTIRLFNTLTGRVEELSASDGKALRMYACGPTVYDYGHIGNFRTFLQVDVLRRFLKLEGIAPKHVMNITDVDDKIIRNAGAAGVSISEYTKKYEAAFFEDLDALARDWLTYWLLDMGRLGRVDFERWIAGWTRPDFLQMPDLALPATDLGRPGDASNGPKWPLMAWRIPLHRQARASCL